MTKPDVVTGRFAPSPTGRMHIGNLYCAVMSWLSAKHQGGRWLLRIEDLDPDRSRREYALQIMDDLHWLGLEWDAEPIWQSERTEIYADYFRRLSERTLVYPCYCRRADLLAASAPHNADGMPIYPGTCRPTPSIIHHPTEQKPAYTEFKDNYLPKIGQYPTKFPAWRIAVPDADITFHDYHKGTVTRNLAREVGDFIIRRSDGTYAYQLSVVVDDALTGVTEVVRGDDLLTSAAQQIFLYNMLSLLPPHFAHIPLLYAPDGRRLSKRDRSMNVGELRSHHTPASLLGEIAFRAHLITSPIPLSLKEILYIYTTTLSNRRNLS